YLMDRRLGVVKVSFEDIVLRRSGHKFQDLYYQQYVELGFYAEQVGRYLKLFGKDNVHIILFEDFKNDPLRCFKGVCSFLGISVEYEPKLVRYNTFALPGNKLFGWVYHLNWLRRTLITVFPDKEKRFLEDFVLSDKQKPPISMELTNLLWNIYESDTKQLNNLLGRNLHDYWRTHDQSGNC
ncbi:MAG: sulfotransferase domain-containing protein, partial [Acidobacteria bacterium]|nr:sulfotransferase domain-containing protein [Acidobacteriota bacterium]